MQDRTVRCLGQGTSVWFLQACSLRPLQPPLSSAEAPDLDLPSPDENVSPWETMSAVGEVESYPPGRWTRNYLPVDPLPARTEAPLDCLATGITDEKGFWVKTACQKGDSNTPLPEQGMLPLPTHPSPLIPTAHGGFWQ